MISTVLRWMTVLACLLAFGPIASAEEAGPAEDDPWPVKIRPEIPYVDLPNLVDGKPLRLQRSQDPDAMVGFDFGYTSRPCLPFCIQPMQLQPGVQTIGELEIIEYLKKMDGGDDNILIIDSRTDNWLNKGMIPGAISIPWKKLHYRHTDKATMLELLEFEFGVANEGDFLNFENAKTLVLYCNGNWCGQSPTTIRSLLMLGYPAHKLKWYRGGMQAWKMLGFITITPAGELVEE